jgi:hypothetical protein
MELILSYMYRGEINVEESGIGTIRIRISMLMPIRIRIRIGINAKFSQEKS